MMSITIVRTISFSIYQRAKYTYAAYIYQICGENPLVTANEKGRYPTLATVACFATAGATTGSIISLIACEYA